jgi:hypothetical protein
LVRRTIPISCLHANASYTTDLGFVLIALPSSLRPFLKKVILFYIHRMFCCRVWWHENQRTQTKEVQREQSARVQDRHLSFAFELCRSGTGEFACVAVRAFRRRMRSRVYKSQSVTCSTNAPSVLLRNGVGKFLAAAF